MPALRPAAWAFVAALAASAPAAAEIVHPYPLPGSAATVARLAGVTGPVEPGRALAILAKALHGTPEGINVETEANLKRLRAAFNTVSRFETLLKPVQPVDGALSLALAADPNARTRLDTLLQYIDLTVRNRGGRFVVERRNNREAAARAQTLAFLGVEVATLADRLNAGEPVRLVVPREDIAVPLSAETWSRLIFNRPVDPRWLAAEIVTNRRAALLAYGLLSVDDRTAEYLATHPALVKRLYEEQSSVFAGFGASLRIENGAVVTPGGPGSAALWEAVTGVPASRPEEFVRVLLGAGDGSLAYVYDLLAHLDAPHQAFASGAWMGDARTRRERFKALIDATVILTSGWKPLFFPFLRPTYDAALLLASVRVDAAGIPARPDTRRLWRLAFGAQDLPERPDRELRNLEGEGLIDAAWLVEQAALFDPRDRAGRLHQVAFGQRLFGSAANSDLPDVLVTLAGYPPFATTYQALERAGITSPRTYALTARRARALSALNGARAPAAVAQYQGALALVTRLARSGALAPDRARALADSLAALDHPDGRYRGAVVHWLVSQLAPALEAEGPLREATLAQGILPERLARVRGHQPAVTLEAVLAACDIAARLSAPDVSLAVVADAVTALSGLTRAWPAPEARTALDQVTRGLARITRPNDLGRVARAIEPLTDLIDDGLAEVLLTLAYAGDVPDAALATLTAGTAVPPHDFGFAEDGWWRQYRRWAEPQLVAIPGVGWRVSGSVLGMDLGLAVFSPTGQPAGADVTADAEAMLRSLALLNPAALRTSDMQRLAGALAAGRSRVAALAAAPATARTLAADAQMDPMRARALGWDAAHAPGRVAEHFTMTELLMLGGASPESFAAWGTASLAGCPCSEIVPPGLAPALVGRQEARLLPRAVADLHLRVAELLVELDLPADRFRPVLARAIADVISQPPLANPDDWLARAQRAQALTRARVEGYLAAIPR